jgi:citrate synthase
MQESVTLTYNGRQIQLPVVIGTEGEKAIDISTLRADTGFITLDPGYANTGSCLSAITYMDGEKGILRYRGIPVEQLAETCDLQRDRLPADQRQAAQPGTADPVFGHAQ